VLSKNTPYISRLDHLRGFAALLVISYHFAGSVIDKDSINPLLVLIRGGESGVGLFMVLSGFILTRISLGKEIIYRQFLYNRLLRIYPLYVFAVAIAAYTAGRHMDFISIVSMLSTVGIVANVNLPRFQQIWTIAVEFQFYLIFPFLVKFLGRYGARYIVGLIALAVLVRGMMFITDGSIQDAAYWTIVGRIDQFSVGMLAAMAYAHRRILLSSPAALVIGLLAVYAWTLLWFNTTGGFYGERTATTSGWIVAPLLEALVWGFLALAYLEQKWSMHRALDKTLSYLGSISFSLYVWHFPVFAALNKVPEVYVSSLWFVNFLFVAMPLIVGLSSLSYFIIEKPFFAIRKVYVTSLQPAPNEAEDVAPKLSRVA
jgi:peptidoglycan/LPS O-acetylase OafA/YrhL